MKTYKFKVSCPEEQMNKLAEITLLEKIWNEKVDDPCYRCTKKTGCLRGSVILYNMCYNGNETQNK
jgi:pimeloyl-CoA synthetase